MFRTGGRSALDVRGGLHHSGRRSSKITIPFKPQSFRTAGVSMTGPVLAVDQGTSGTKALVVCPERGVIGSGSAPVRPRYGAGGVVEADPAELLASVVDAGQQAVREAGEPVAAVGLA